MKEKMLTGILAVEDPYYIEKNIVPMNDKGIFRPFPLTEEEGSFLKPDVKKERFDREVSFLFDAEKISGRITFQKKDYSHLVPAFSVQFSAKQDPDGKKESFLEEEDLRTICRLLSQKLKAHVQVKVALNKLISFVNGIELKSKTPKKQDFTFQKLFEHAAKAAEEPLQKYIDERFDFWFACGENEAAEYRALFR